MNRDRYALYVVNMKFFLNMMNNGLIDQDDLLLISGNLKKKYGIKIDSDISLINLIQHS